jgi:F0F1-type ATP synthase membrane subunit b/b'
MRGQLVFFILVAAPAAMAAESGENAAESLLGWGFRWVHFVVLALGLGYLLLKKAPAFFRGRAEGIFCSISESARLKEEADRLLRTSEAKLARLGEEMAELRAAAARDGAAEGERIREAAREEVRKIERAALMEIEATERAARLELKALAACRAVERAEAQLRREVTSEKQAVLVRMFVQGLGGAR